MTKVKRVPIWRDNHLVDWRPMERKDVLAYFRSLRWNDKRAGEFCERCSAIIQRGVNNFKGWDLCDFCYQYKKDNKPETTPDIEDVQRFNIEAL